MNNMNKMITSLGITRAASYWYPTMLAEAAGEISEAKAAELLGMGIVEYRKRRYDAIQAVLGRYDAIQAVLDFIHVLPSPIVSLLDAIEQKPELFNE